MPLVPFPQFVGSDYTAMSVNVAASELVNFYVEQTQSSADQVFPARLQPTPGLAVVATDLQAPIRAIYSQDGRVFVVGGTKFYELHGDGSTEVLGTMAQDDQPATITSNGHGGHQILITSAGLGYIFDLASGGFGQAPGIPSNLIMADYIDGYFVVLQATTSKFWLSAIRNGNIWTVTEGAGGSGLIESSSDDLLAFRVLSRNVWFFGSLRTEVWTNQGGEFFPLAPVQPLMEAGIAAPWALQDAFGSLCFIVKTKHGEAAVLQTEGYGVKPISTHNESEILDALPDLFNVRAFTYQEMGHVFYVICPNTGPALVYDLMTGLWHRRGVWDAGTETYRPLKQWCHAFGHGRHLVGDRESGTIYEQSLAYGTDAGVPIRRVRTCPHINQDQQWLFGSQVSIGVETGLAPSVPASGGVLRPQELLLSFSKDGGHTFSEPRSGSMGDIGQYGKLVAWHQTPGRFHDLVLRAETTSAYPVRINSCQLRVEPGRGAR